MDKYVCNRCGNEFEGDFSTTKCPKCGSEDIKKAGRHIGNKGKIIYIGLGIIATIVLLVALLKSDSLLEASLIQNEKGVLVSIEPGDLYKSYHVLVEFNNETYNTLSFNKNGVSNIVLYDEMHPGTYYFKVIRNDKQPFKLKWKTRNSYVKEADPEAPIITAKGIEKDRITKKWARVEVTLLNEETQTGVEYTLGGQTQTSNIFCDIEPGTYEVKARNSHNLVGSYTLILPQIRPIQPKLSIQEMNIILYKLHSRSMNLGDARTKFSESGDIKLRYAIDDYTSLFDVLSYTRQVGAPQYVVVSCDYNEDNQIVSGSLELRRK